MAAVLFFSINKNKQTHCIAYIERVILVPGQDPEKDLILKKWFERLRTLGVGSYLLKMLRSLYPPRRFR